MRVRVGCEFNFGAAVAIPSVWQVRPRADRVQSLAYESLTTEPNVAWSSYHDLFGNVCDRLTMTSGQMALRYEAHVGVSDLLDDADKDARQVPVESLPDETMGLPAAEPLLPLRDVTGTRHGTSSAPRNRDGLLSWRFVYWAHGNVEFQPGSSTPLTTAFDVWQNRTGVCRVLCPAGRYFLSGAQHPCPLCLRLPARYWCTSVR